MEREGIWYFHKFVNGKREFNGRKTPFSLETSDLNVAKAKRDAILRAGNGAEIDRVMGRSSRKAATIGEIFKAYRAAPTVRANADSRERNLEDLVRMVRRVKGADFDVDGASSEILTKQLVKDWQAMRLAQISAAYRGEILPADLAKLGGRERGALEGLRGDLAAVESAKRSLNSLLTHVQSLFSREARDNYSGLHLPPNIEEFATALPVPARKQDEPRPLTDAIVQQLFVDVAKLREENVAAWAAFQLMTWGGLRNKECMHARENWLEELPAGYRLELKPTGDFLPKGNSRAVILPREIGLELLAAVAAGPQPAPAEDGQPVQRHLVPADSKTKREDAVYRELGAWLRVRGVGEEASKTAYRLRKYFLKKVQEQQGLMFAQAAGGHSSAQTTINHYIGKPVMSEPIKLAGA